MPKIIIHLDKFCVYTHSFNGVVFYVGKGRSYRPFEITKRNSRWVDFMKDKPSYDVEIVEWFGSHSEALLFEAVLIRESNPSCNLMMNGYKISDSHKAKIRNAQKNKIVSTETRNKISKARLISGTKPPVRKKGDKRKGHEIKCDQTGFIFHSMGEAARVMNIPKSSIRVHLKGSMRHVYGYTFSKS